jgi:tripartite-type tricarboxylate transporter receptor subunit TctC
MNRAVLFTILFCTLVPAATAAESYPAKPIRIVSPFPPGGPNDVLSRIVGAYLFESSGHPAIVDNRAGANGIIGNEIVAKATPDGYTLVVNSGSMTINAHVYRKLPYDLMRDFRGVSMIAAPAGLVLVTAPPSGIKTFKELIAQAKQKPGQLSFGSPGAGSALELAGELIAALAGVQIIEVPYKGFAPALTDLIGGRIHGTIISTVSVLPQIQAGKLIALAQTGVTREASLPSVPTMIEEGLAGFDITGWFGVWVPARTPGAIVQQLSAEIARVLALPEVRARYTALGVEPKASTPAEFDAFVRADYERIGRYVKLVNKTQIDQ